MVMKFKEIIPPRRVIIETKRGEPIEISDCAHIELFPDELVTFKTPSGTEYDVVRKSWGYYSTPSLNGRLQGFGLRAVLVKNLDAKYYVLLVESGQEDFFQDYCDVQEMTVVCWLDNDRALKILDAKLNSS